jgi:mannose-6-phosphate isomerase-like protein (cupin superfamily)
MRSTRLIFQTLLRWSARLATLIAIVVGCLVVADSLYRRECHRGATHKGESYEFMGERLTLLNTGQETNGEVLEIDVSFKPTTETNVLKWQDAHVHSHQEEPFEVISGAVPFRIGDREQVLTAGQRITGPPNTPHRWNSADGKDIHMRAELRPALHTDAAFSSAQHVRGKMSLLQAAVIMSEFEGIAYPTKPPPLFMKGLVKVLAPIARLLGYRAC